MSVLQEATAVAVKIGFTEEQTAAFRAAGERILAQSAPAFAVLERAVLVGADTEAMFRDVSRSVGLEDDFGMLTLCLLLTPAVRRLYRDQGISGEIFYDSMREIQIWAKTCLDSRRRLGLYEYGWIRNFFTASIVRLGRLEFHIVPFSQESAYSACGITVNPGDPVINTHIPADGPLDPEQVLDAFRRAYRYFGKTGLAPIVCRSWLLYPKNRLFCAPDSRIVAFLDCFDILESSEPNVGDLWRVFGWRDVYDPDTLPENSSLQKRLKRRLQSGGCMGEGYGVLLHDGENIVRRST